MKISYMILLCLIMAIVTYLIRVIPLAFCRKKIKSRFINNLLFYIPYAVLSAMTFPFIFYSTGNIYTALIGTFIAIFAAICKQSLLIVSCLSCLGVFISSLIII